MDLFQTLWGVVETPAKTFHAIAIAEHKNYAYFLFGLAGIPAFAATLSLLQAGVYFPSLIEAMVAVLVGGMVVGLLAAPGISLVHALVVRVLGGDWSFRTSLGVMAYALAPAGIIGLLLLPIQLLTFGLYYFTSNPPASIINPVSFWALVVLQFLAGLWSLTLLASGTGTACRLTKLKSGIVALLVYAITTAGWWWVWKTVYQGMTQRT